MRNKKFLLIFSVTFIILFFLTSLYFSQYLFSRIFLLILLSILITFLIIKVENRLYLHKDDTSLSYDYLDIARFVGAIIIIILHLRPFLNHFNPLDITFNNIISRICVPLYFLITGYFVAKKEPNNPNYIKDYIKSNIPLYLLWSLIYLPLGLDYIAQLNLPIYLYPVALIVSLVYIGTYYHLWYFPALFLSLWILKVWKKHFKLSILLFISFILLCLGATETYYGLLPISLQDALTKYYFNIFYTTRNFLFFGLFYVTLGYHIGQKKQSFVPHSFFKMLLSLLALILEVIFLQATHRLNSNIMFACIPLVYYLFITLIHLGPLFKKRHLYRPLSKYYYLVHPLIIFISQNYLFHYYTNQPFIELGVVLLATHLLSLLLIYIKPYLKKIPI